LCRFERDLHGHDVKIVDPGFERRLQPQISEKLDDHFAALSPSLENNRPVARDEASFVL
jgi:hypothetical protein